MLEGVSERSRELKSHYTDSLNERASELVTV